MATAKVTINGTTILNLTDATAAASNIISPYTAYGADGTKLVGTSSGGSASLQTKSVSYTPSETSQSETLTPSSGYDGFSSVSVSVGAISTTYVGSSISRRSSSDLAVSGATVTVPAGYYSSQATKSVASGTAGTPIATKGTVNNHALSVTPSVTNTAGYISGGTNTGTAVTVSASELVSGSQTITNNGTVDVTNLASVIVNVSGGGGGGQTVPATIATATATPAAASASISFTGLSGEPTSFVVLSTASSLATGASPFKTAAVVFDGTDLHGQTITNTNNAQVTYDGTNFSKSYSNGTLTITGSTYWQANQYVLVYTYDSSAIIDIKNTQVGSGASSITFTGLTDEPSYFSCIFKSNFGTSSGYQRVIAVVYDGTSTYGLEMDSAAKYSNTHWSYTYANGSLTISSQGTNAGGYFHQPGNYQLTYAVGTGEMVDTGIVTAPATITATEATATISTNTLTLSKTVSVTPDVTVPGYISQGTAGDSYISLIATVTTKAATTITPTESEQTAVAANVYTTGIIKVGAISSTYVGSGITSRSSSDLTVSGATVTVPAGYYSEQATKSVTTMTLPTSAASSATSGYTSKATISRSTSNQYINIPPGYNSAGGYYLISAVANGSATAPASISGTSATVTTGTNTLTLTKSVSVTPSVTAGYISSGTAGNASVTLTASVTIKAAATITPTKSSQTIASGTYLTGTQTIAAIPAAYQDVTGVTAAAGDVVSGKSIVSSTGATVNGTLVIQHYYTGSSAPSSSTGVNGDIYLQTS